MNTIKVVIVLFVLSLFVAANTAPASAEEPVGGCPDGFHLHSVEHHNHGAHGEHKHVGNDEDLNEDGYICGKHVGKNGDVHVHIDNNVPADESD